MTNREKFSEIFNYYADEVWAFSNEEYLNWANAEYKERKEEESYICKQCGKKYWAEPQRHFDEFFGFYFWGTKCPFCGASNEFNNSYWR